MNKPMATKFHKPVASMTIREMKALDRLEQDAPAMYALLKQMVDDRPKGTNFINYIARLDKFYAEAESILARHKS